MNIRFASRAAAAAALLLVPLGAAAQSVMLKAGTFLPTNEKFWYPPIQQFLDTVNAKGKPVGLAITMVAAGARAMSPFEMGNAVKSGVLDLVHLNGTFYARLVPIADAWKLSALPVQELRKNGTFEYLEKIYNERINAHLLGNWGNEVPFHIYVNRKIDKADLRGLKIRGNTVYQSFVERLGGTLVQTSPGDAYTALERGVVDGIGGPFWGIEAWGWEKVVKYRTEPGFYRSNMEILVNLDSWKKLDSAQQDVLTHAAIELENEFPKTRAANDAEAQRIQQAAGIQVIELTGAERKKWAREAIAAGWDDVLKKDPVHAPRIRELMTQK